MSGVLGPVESVIEIPAARSFGPTVLRGSAGPYCLKASLTFSPASLRSALPWSRSPFDCRLLLPVARPASSLTSPVSHWRLLLALSRRLMTFPSLVRLESASHVVDHKDFGPPRSRV